jgi:DNA-binding transcriptional MocR family regulator
MTDVPIKFTRGVPPDESFPKEELAQITVEMLAEYGNVVLQYGSSFGFTPLRDLIARESGVPVDHVIIGQGSLHLLDLFCQKIIRHRDIVYVESPTYDRTITLLRRAGAHVSGFRLNSDGPDVDELAQRLRGGDRPLFFYTVPDFQNPSGTVLSRQKRERIVELADRYGFLIIEDIPYRRLRYRGEAPPSFYELYPRRTIQLSSFSKLIAPGLRVGYMVAAPEVISGLAKYAEDSYINTSFLNQALVYGFAHSGQLNAHLGRLSALYNERLDAALASLDEHFTGMARWHRPDGGFFIGVTLNKKVKAETLLRGAANAGLALSDGRGFFPNGGGEEFIRLPFCALTPDEIRTGIARLADVVKTLR